MSYIALASFPGHSQILSRSCGEKLRVAWGQCGIKTWEWPGDEANIVLYRDQAVHFWRESSLLLENFFCRNQLRSHWKIVFRIVQLSLDKEVRKSGLFHVSFPYVNLQKKTTISSSPLQTMSHPLLHVGYPYVNLQKKKTTISSSPLQTMSHPLPPMLVSDQNTKEYQVPHGYGDDHNCFLVNVPSKEKRGIGTE